MGAVVPGTGPSTRPDSGPSSPELPIALDRAAREPLHAQIEREVRQRIRDGRLAAGTRLPSTRLLAADLGVARGVVSEAYAQLRAEGWLAARRGAGTAVAARSSGGQHNDGRAREVAPSAREAPIRFDLRYDAPDLSAFPRARWLAATRAALAELPDAALGYGDPRGSARLRVELSQYLGRVRAVVADPAHMVLCNGTVQGLGLVAHALADGGVRRVAVEDPGWAAQRSAVERAGLEAVPTPVDGDGLDVDGLEALDVDAAILTPAHQFPTGAVLAPERRQRLVAWAERHDAYLVEDDYDAEYRYDRSATGSLQALAPDRVVYAGSASKTLAPALRLGWLVLPPALAGPVALEKHRADRSGPALEQQAYAHLLASGDLDRHLRRTRLRYAGRRAQLLESLERHMPGSDLRGASAGLHAVASLPAATDERLVVECAGAAGIALKGVAELHLARPPDRPALLLGYGAIDEGRIDAAIAELAGMVDAAGDASMAEPPG